MVRVYKYAGSKYLACIHMQVRVPMYLRVAVCTCIEWVARGGRAVEAAVREGALGALLDGDMSSDLTYIPYL